MTKKQEMQIAKDKARKRAAVTSKTSPTIGNKQSSANPPIQPTMDANNSIIAKGNSLKTSLLGPKLGGVIADQTPTAPKSGPTTNAGQCVIHLDSSEIRVDIPPPESPTDPPLPSPQDPGAPLLKK